jgi:uncharacterized protein
MTKTKFSKVILVIGAIALLFFLTKYSLLKWGALRIETDQTITVRGSYTMQITNRIATYTIGINATNKDKEPAINEVKSKSDNLIKILVDYGIPREDIQTTGSSIYQKEEPYYENGVQKFKKTDWTASTSIGVTLREVDKVDDFSSKVYSAEISDLSGPFFALDYNTQSDTEILQKAIENVENKASTLARAMGKNLGEVVTIKEEEMQGFPIVMSGKVMGGGGGDVAQAGSTSVTKSVSVTYKIY